MSLMITLEKGFQGYHEFNKYEFGPKLPFSQSKESGIREKAQLQVQKIEGMLVKKTKDNILKIFGDWKQDFDPNAAYGLSYIGWLNDVIRKESFGCISYLEEHIQHVTTRKKIVKVLKETLDVIANGRPFVNTPTAQKLDQATMIIEKELKELGPLPHKLASDQTSMSKFPKVAGDEALKAKKMSMYEEIKKWKEGFVPIPAYALSYIPSVADIISRKVETIYAYFIKRISHASDEASFLEAVVETKSRLIDFRSFINAESADKLDEAIGLLSGKM
jgi:hypothetical protein